jgi:uncharacterized protein YpuA (DUF1002 family)
MAKVIGMNKNYKEVAGVLAMFPENKAFAREVLNKMLELDAKCGRTFNSVNATLAAMAGKGYVDKKKEINEAEEKILTRYTLTELGLAELAKKEDEPAEAPAE